MPIVYVCNVGPTLTRPPRFGWARCVAGSERQISGCADIELLVETLRRDVLQGRSIAIGFESPLFIPVPEKAEHLSRGRDGEGNRSFSAPAGGYVTTLGVHQSAWILRELWKVARSSHTYTADWNEWPPQGRPILFCWEAFVSGDAHSAEDAKADNASHARDAATAVTAFLNHERSLGNANAVSCNPRLSLLHAVALWTGWSRTLSGLHDPVLVIKPDQVYRGPIEQVEPSSTPAVRGRT